jgi:hypothetical protein
MSAGSRADTTVFGLLPKAAISDPPGSPEPDIGAVNVGFESEHCTYCWGLWR